MSYPASTHHVQQGSQEKRQMLSYMNQWSVINNIEEEQGDNRKKGISWWAKKVFGTFSALTSSGHQKERKQLGKSRGTNLLKMVDKDNRQESDQTQDVQKKWIHNPRCWMSTIWKCENHPWRFDEFDPFECSYPCLRIFRSEKLSLPGQNITSFKVRLAFQRMIDVSLLKWSCKKIKLTLSVAESLEGGLVTELVLAGLHDKSQTGVDTLTGLNLLLVDRGHCWIYF